MSEGESPGKRVLVAWDGSAAASTAIPVAQRVAEQLAAEVETLCVVKDEEELRGWEESLRPEAVRLGVGMRLVVGEVAKEIVEAAEAEEVSLVALTTHGRDIERDGVRLGSVAEAVIARVRLPVLILKPAQVAGQAAPSPMRRLLVPIDGTPKTAEALRPVTELASALKATIDLLYVTDPRQKPPSERGSMTSPRYVDQPQHEWPEWAAEVARRLSSICAGCPKEIEVHTYLARGDAGEEIRKFAIEHQSDAIVLVRRSRFQPGRAKVIRAVLRDTPSYVIIVGGEDG
jgi:nucleotide-binding universal stress UspA family protein